jgi:RimJ/RimL family protein N-acetyltransferase
VWGTDLLDDDWPLGRIRMRIGDVALRPVREPDLPALLQILPDDAEHDPSSVMLEGLDLEANRRRLFLQSYWNSRASWSVDHWWIMFLVARGGEVVGVQALEADHFPVIRTVDSFSWLDVTARGEGVGKAMRAAVLALAFDHLGAQTAVSSAREENRASLGVSKALGYEDNGVSRSLSPTGACTLRHMILHRAAWRAGGRGPEVRVEGLGGCAAWFGVDVVEKPEPGGAGG